MAKENITIRRATIHDKEAVLKINENVYGGLDGLPYFYEKYLSSPDIMAAVMLCNNEIIAFEFGRLVDNGKTVITDAARMKLKFSGRRWMKRLAIFLNQWGKRKGADTFAFAMDDIRPYTSSERLKTIMRLLLIKKYPMYAIDGPSLCLNDVTGDSRILNCAGKELSVYFKTKIYADYLFPQGRILINSNPLKLLEENIPFILDDTAVSFSDIELRSESCHGLLSFGTVYKVSNPRYRYNVDIFGTDSTSLKSHIVRHLSVVKERTTGITMMLTFVQHDFELSKIDEVFSEVGIERTVTSESETNPSKCIGLHVFEWLERHANKL